MSSASPLASTETLATPPPAQAEPGSTVARVGAALLWVPSLYLAMGIPFNVIMGGTASRMYKSIGYSDAQITVALGSIGIAWTLKPLWAAFLDMFGTKRGFVLAMELLIAVLLAGVALTLPVPGLFQVGIALLWVAAFASSTQDICADGLYLTVLAKPLQARLVGVQSTFWILGKILATGLLISVLDRVRSARQWPEEKMWMAVWLIAAGAMLGLALWHAWTLPSGRAARRPGSVRQVAHEFLDTAVTFFHKRSFWGMMAFVFFFRFGEGLILMEGQLFLQSSRQVGGLGLSAGEVSAVDAVWGTIATIAGGLLGGAFVARFGLARVLLVLALCLNLPHLTYVYLSQVGAQGQGADYLTIVVMVAVEKFGYGFGFVGNMVYMMQQLAPGRSTMTHYAFATSLMNLVLVPTNMISGPLAEWLGFSTFFLVVMLASVPSIWVAWKAPFPLGCRNSVRGVETEPMSDAEQAVQLLAGRASLLAMLNILTLLIVDTRILGSLHGRGAEPPWIQLGLLGVTASVKLVLTRRSLRAAREALRAAAAVPGSTYVRNARGAQVATACCGLGGLAVLGLAAMLVR